MHSRSTIVIALAGSAAAFAPMGTPTLRKPVRPFVRSPACFCMHLAVWESRSHRGSGPKGDAGQRGFLWAVVVLHIRATFCSEAGLN